MPPVLFFKSLADETRLKAILLIHQESELCVCELMEALQESQPKVSRHLALLRSNGLLQDRKVGQWVFYRVHPELPQWMAEQINNAKDHNLDYLEDALSRLNKMGQRPDRQTICC